MSVRQPVPPFPYRRWLAGCQPATRFLALSPLSKKSANCGGPLPSVCRTVLVLPRHESTGCALEISRVPMGYRAAMAAPAVPGLAGYGSHRREGGDGWACVVVVWRLSVTDPEAHRLPFGTRTCAASTVGSRPSTAPRPSRRHDSSTRRSVQRSTADRRRPLMNWSREVVVAAGDSQPEGPCPGRHVCVCDRQTWVRRLAMQCPAWRRGCEAKAQKGQTRTSFRSRPARWIRETQAWRPSLRASTLAANHP